MVCEFLPPKYKAKLVDLAKPVELAEAGYTLQSAYKIKQKKVISDEKCEELVKILGERLRP
uniref:Hypothetical PepJ protein n=1 Tax=Acidianus ambivalens TaxID=2283 RepID=O57699_ACIAM|nr:PepJ protein [Acidianus ambivalens]CAA12522.1 hypothetical PepJ protein [Acidianus ambivalens]